MGLAVRTFYELPFFSKILRGWGQFKTVFFFLAWGLITSPVSFQTTPAHKLWSLDTSLSRSYNARDFTQFDMATWLLG
ncbi:uncharacterized protein TrAFT101_010494 [Trichoderma asperellum]|uniref:uncharacterized protein n=1 Tax=Trichoderma asperellum TaxID=101201 RepID=UPI0033343118|nr:hypothetical protein TrAFT101_010494 [Trichoderma asperellum]